MKTDKIYGHKLPFNDYRGQFNRTLLTNAPQFTAVLRVRRRPKLEVVK